MLEIKDVTLSMKEDGRRLVDHFSFTLHPGEKAVMIGEEGNGKSTLLKYIYNSSLIDGYCDAQGTVETHGMRLGYLEQEMPQAWMERRVKEFFDGVDVYASAGEAAWSLGGDCELLDSTRRVSSLSGGEKVKIRLLRLLAEQTDVLLLDEPTNDLDMEALAWMENFLNRLQVPVLYISHDETLMERTANTVIHLEMVRRKTQPRHTVARTGYRQYVEQRLSLLEKQERVAKKQRENYTKQMERWQQIYNKVEHQQEAISRANPGGGRLLKKKIKNLKSQEKRIERGAEEFEEIPDVEDAVLFRFENTLRVPAGKAVLDFSLDTLTVGNAVLSKNIRLYVRGGEHVAIVGKNGAGKTTLLKLLWELLQNRTDLQVGYMPQNYADILDDRLTPAEFLAPAGDKQAMTKAFTFLGSVKFTREEMTHPLRELSGGQQAKLLLVSFILRGCNVLLLDEPTRNLSPISNPVIRRVLADFQGTIISVSHDRKYISEVCTTVYRYTANGLVHWEHRETPGSNLL